VTAYWVGDQPAEQLLVAPARDGRPIDLEPYSNAAATLTTPAGATVPAAGASIVTDPDEGPVVAVQLPQLTAAGLWQLHVTITTDDGASSTFEAAPVVVQEFDGWHSIGSAHAEWPDSRALDDHRLWVLLETAKLECLAYARPLPADPPALPPVNYREAQLLHARNRNAAGKIDPSNGDAGGDGFSLSAFPIDWTVRQLLRPQRGGKRAR
jgi:hypothetical protein